MDETSLFYYIIELQGMTHSQVNGVEQEVSVVKLLRLCAFAPQFRDLLRTNFPQQAEQMLKPRKFAGIIREWYSKEMILEEFLHC